MGQQGDGASAPENFGQAQGWTPEQAPPTVIGAGPAGNVPGPPGGQPDGQPFQASPWPSYQPPANGDPQFGGQPQWGQQPGAGQPQWGQPSQWGQQPGGQQPQWGQQAGGGQPQWGQQPQFGGQQPGGQQPQWGQPSQPGGYGGPFTPYDGQSPRMGPGMLFQAYRRSRRRRPFLRTAIIVFIVFIVAGIIAAVNQNSDSDDSGDAPSNAPAATYNATVGAGVTLAGMDAGEQLKVTVSKVFATAPPSDQFNKPPAGDRLYAVQFALKNTGSAAYSDAPGNSATIFDSAGKTFQTEFDEASDCTSLPAEVNLAAGASSSGCIVFKVPKASKITKVQFILDSGMGPQTGNWKLG